MEPATITTTEVVTLMAFDEAALKNVIRTWERSNHLHLRWVLGRSEGVGTPFATGTFLKTIEDNITIRVPV